MPCKVYKIGVFFDGTGNNKDFDISHGRDQQSNVAKLYALYKTGKFACEQGGCKVEADKLYEKGIGTYDTQEEYDAHPIQRKYDKGGGGGGGARINDAIAQVTKLLDAHPFHRSDDTKYATRLIDVFGFSRGAALARDFVNTFTKRRINVPNGKYQDVRFNFIGLFDTVGSFGEPGNDVNMKSMYPDLFSEADIGPGGSLENYMIEEHNNKNKTLTHKELFAKKEAAEARAAKLNRYDGMKAVVAPYYPPNPYGVSIVPSGYQVVATIKERDAYDPYNFNLCMESAKRIMHFIAHDEVRKNFPLTDIYGSGGAECEMLGVHSDIGGGYPPQKIERHRFEYRGHFRGVKEAAREHAKRLSGSIKGLWSVEHVACSRAGRGYYILNRHVLNDLANVTLNLMHEEALKHKVHFDTLPQDENHAVLPNIETYYRYAKAHMRKAYTYEQTKDGERIEATLRHHSAADPAGRSTHYVGNTKLWDDAWKNDSADGGGNDARYVDAKGDQIDGREHPMQAQNVQRAVFHNIPDKAVKPTNS